MERTCAHPGRFPFVGVPLSVQAVLFPLGHRLQNLVALDVSGTGVGNTALQQYVCRLSLAARVCVTCVTCVCLVIDVPRPTTVYEQHCDLVPQATSVETAQVSICHGHGRCERGWAEEARVS